MGLVTTNTYDPDQNLISTTDPQGNTTTYTYDADNEKTGETWYNAAGATIQLETWTFDANGNTLQPVGKLTHSWPMQDTTIVASTQDPNYKTLFALGAGGSY